MSIKFRVNDENPLVASHVGKGDSWEYVRVKGSGGDRKTITIWADNAPTGIEEGDAFRVTQINGVRYASRKDAKGEWRDEFHVNADIERVGPAPEELKNRYGVKKKKSKDGDAPARGSAPEWTPPPREEREPTFYDIMTGVDSGDDGLPF